MPGLTRNGRRVQPMTWLGIALLVLLVTVDAVIWFSRSDDDAFAESSPLETDRKDGPRASDSAAGPPSEALGNYVLSRITPGGRIATDHYLVTAEPVMSVRMKIRTTGYPEFAPAVEQLQVFAGGEQVSSAPIPTPRAFSRIRLGKPSTVVHLHYETSGAVVASVPSRSGRALALVNPVKVKAETSAGRHVVEMQGQVLGLSCSTGRQIAEPCGDPGGDGWKVKPNGDKSAVLAQVDTPS